MPPGNRKQEGPPDRSPFPVCMYIYVCVCVYIYMYITVSFYCCYYMLLLLSFSLRFRIFIIGINVITIYYCQNYDQQSLLGIQYYQHCCSLSLYIAIIIISVIISIVTVAVVDDAVVAIVTQQVINNLQSGIRSQALKSLKLKTQKGVVMFNTVQSAAVNHLIAVWFSHSSGPITCNYRNISALPLWENYGKTYFP